MSLLILRRILWGVPVLWVVATLTFLIMHWVPGGPFDQEKKLPPEILANIEAKYHLDQPFGIQYLLYMKNLLRGDLGPSYKYIGRSVNDILKDSFPVSLHLGFIALGFAILVGFLSGILSAVFFNSWIDRTGMFFATVGISFPSFVLAAFLIFIFSNLLHLFPPALWEGWRYTVLPGIALGAGPAAYLARLTRSSVLEVLKKEYVTTARAKGLGEFTILFKHILKNSLSPVVTILGPLAAALVTGSFVIEFIFSVPGMGKFFVTAVTNRDYPLIMGVTLTYSLLIVLANLIVDLFYTYLDPRTRVD